MQMKSKSFVGACLEYFGRKEGQTALEFKQELDALTVQDRIDLTKMFPSVGYEIIS